MIGVRLPTYCFVLERAKAFDLQVFGHWTEQELDHGLQRLLDNQEVRLLDRLKVLEETLSEEIVNYVEVVLLTGVRRRRRLPRCLNHA